MTEEGLKEAWPPVVPPDWSCPACGAPVKWGYYPGDMICTECRYFEQIEYLEECDKVE